MNSNVIVKAADLARDGKVMDARRMLAGELVDHPENADAWLALAGLMDDRERAAYYIKRALELCPENRQAQVFLAKLEMGAKPKVGMLAAMEAARETGGGWLQPMDARKRRQHKALASAGLILSAALVAIIAAMIMLLWRPDSSAAAQAHEVTYRVTSQSDAGDSAVRVTYHDERGRRITQEIDLPGAQWTFQLADGSAASITIANYGQTGTVTCEILVDGLVWRSDRAEGTNPVAICSGRLGGQ
jgi:hypothetical protein